MARGRSNAAPVSLFPFLAVLMCTMGALIVLLVLVSAQVRDDAVAKAKQEREKEDAAEQEPEPEPVISVPEPEVIAEEELIFEPLPPVEPLPVAPDLDAMRRSLEQLTAEFNAKEKELVRRRDQLAAMQSEMQVTQRDIQLAVASRRKLEEELNRATQQRDLAEKDLAELDTERTRILKAIAESKKLILDQQKKLAGGTEFEVIPFEGLRGTARRPIIIECTDKAIRFVSEDIKLTPKQLVGFKPDNNPLLAGANQIVQFWANYNAVQADPETQPVPYVLLVVRPSGTVGFYLARKFLAGLGADYGYELVEEDLEFSVPESDPRAREMALAAISEMLASRSERDSALTFSEALEKGGNSDGAGGRERGGSRNGTADGAGRTPNGGRGNGPGGLRNSLAEAAKSGQSFDSRILRHGPSAADSFFESSRFRNRSKSSGSGAAGGIPIGVGQSGRRPGSGSLNGISGNSRGGTGQTGAGQGGSEGQGSETPGLIPAPRLGAIGERPSGNGIPKPFEFSNGPDPLVAAPGSAGPRSNPLEESVGGSPDGPGTKPGSSNSEEKSTQSAQADSETATGTGDSKSGSKDGTPSGSRQGDAGSPRSSPEAGTGRTSSAVAAIEGTTHPLLKNQGNSKLAGGSRNGPPGESGDPVATLPLPLSVGNPSIERPQPTIDVSRQRPVTRGIRRQWGIRNPAGTIALEMPITIRIGRQEVIIDRKFKITRTVNRSPSQIAEWTLLAIDRVAGEWGVPPKRFYWVPAVTLIIEPGGELMREPLDDRLKRNGVAVETEFVESTRPPIAARPGGTP
jgi:hypothetical protein